MYQFNTVAALNVVSKQHRTIQIYIIWLRFWMRLAVCFLAKDLCELVSKTCSFLFFFFYFTRCLDCFFVHPLLFIKRCDHEHSVNVAVFFPRFITRQFTRQSDFSRGGASTQTYLLYSTRVALMLLVSAVHLRYSSLAGMHTSRTSLWHALCNHKGALINVTGPWSPSLQLADRWRSTAPPRWCQGKIQFTGHKLSTIHHITV